MLRLLKRRNLLLLWDPFACQRTKTILSDNKVSPQWQQLFFYREEEYCCKETEIWNSWKERSGLLKCRKLRWRLRRDYPSLGSYRKSWLIWVRWICAKKPTDTDAYESAEFWPEKVLLISWGPFIFAGSSLISNTFTLFVGQYYYSADSQTSALQWVLCTHSSNSNWPWFTTAPKRWIISIIPNLTTTVTKCDHRW